MISLLEIPTDETQLGHVHHMDDVSGYVAVRTRFGHGRVSDDSVFDANDYGGVIERVRRLRMSAEAGEYARIDVVYADGCRGIL